MTTPVYQHDCQSCVFLGQKETSNGVLYDLYYCTGREKTLLARYGNEPNEYVSCPKDIAEGLDIYTNPKLRLVCSTREALGAALDLIKTKE